MGLIKDVFNALAAQAEAEERQKREQQRQEAAARLAPKASVRDTKSPTEVYVELEAKAATPAALASAVGRLRDVSNEDEPETLGAARSLLRRATTAAKPVLAHARWMLEQDDADERWDEVDTACDLLFQTLEEALDADDVDEVDAFSPLGQLMDALEALGL